jgi:signal transduction histidine kinase
VERHGVGGGHLQVSAQTRMPGHQVTLCVTDNGSGISPENLNKVFTPFFSTKPVGKGTGLGLSVCYGIIDNLGGEMAVSSRKNEGNHLLHPSATGSQGAGKQVNHQISYRRLHDQCIEEVFQARGDPDSQGEGAGDLLLCHGGFSLCTCFIA